MLSAFWINTNYECPCTFLHSIFYLSTWFIQVKFKTSVNFNLYLSYSFCFFYVLQGNIIFSVAVNFPILWPPQFQKYAQRKQTRLQIGTFLWFYFLLLSLYCRYLCNMRLFQHCIETNSILVTRFGVWVHAKACTYIKLVYLV